MVENKRCSNCSYYPFCTNCENPINVCEKWKKKEIEMKLESKNGENFKFGKI